MNKLQYFVDEKLKEVAERLVDSVHNDPASFSCGHNTGYKKCLLDLINAMELDKSDYES